MSVTISLLNELFRGFHIQRWNERIRPMELIEMDKHAHKMFIAYSLAKYEEDSGNQINWELLIKDSIFELFRRIVISDIKSPIYAKIKEQKEVFTKLNAFVFNVLEPKFKDLSMQKDLKDFLLNPSDRECLTLRIADAAHIYSSYWEFLIIKNSNPFGYENTKIETELLDKINNYRDLDGLNRLVNKHTIANFIDKCGQLRFQFRWAQVPRLTKTSVLGHSMMVAVLSYLFVRENGGCNKRLFNAFFGGLFHDMPEIVTRDIISPVKRSSSELDLLIKDLETELTNKEILPLLDNKWHEEVRGFISDEFNNKIVNENGKIITDISTDYINEKYNSDEYNPYDGKLIRAADHLSAFLEAWTSMEAGLKNEELRTAATNLKALYSEKKRKLGKTSLVEIYDSFK